MLHRLGYEQANGHDVHVNGLIYVLIMKTDKTSRLFAEFQIKYLLFL